MKMKNKLENIINKLKINNYKLKDSIFEIQEQSSSALTMKSLIRITSQLDEENIAYRIDHQYNIYILDK